MPNNYYCCVPSCSQRGYQRENGDKVTFHAFPRDEHLRKEWLLRMDRPRDLYASVTKHSKVCSQHFVEEDFVKNVACGRRLLMPTAVPSVFDGPRQQSPTGRGRRRTPSTKQTTSKRKSNRKKGEEEQQLDVTREPQVLQEITEESGNAEASNVSPPWSGDAESVHAAVSTPGPPARKRGRPKGGRSASFQNSQGAPKKGSRAAETSSAVASLQRDVAALRSIHMVLHREYKGVAQKVDVLEAELHQRRFGIEAIKDSDVNVYFYTGIPSFAQLLDVLRLLDVGEQGENLAAWNHKYEARTPATGDPPQSSWGLSALDQFFLVLVRLRLGLLERDLAIRFGIPCEAVDRICFTWINQMYTQLSRMDVWPSRKYVNNTMPHVVQDTCPSTRVVVSVAEIQCRLLAGPLEHPATASCCERFRGLIGIAPNGRVSFVSDLFPTEASLQEVTLGCGLLAKTFDHGDSVLSDAICLDEDLLVDKGVALNVLPCLSDAEEPLSSPDPTWNSRMAALRAHLQPRMNRIRTFHIFDRTIPLSLAAIVNQIWVVCALLTNFQNGASPSLDSLDCQDVAY